MIMPLEITFAAAMVTLLIGYCIYLSVKYRNRSADSASSRARLLSWGIGVSLTLFAIFIASLATMIFTCAESADATRTFAFQCRGGQPLYTHPALAIVWWTSFVGSALSGILNLIIFMLQEKRNMKQLRAQEEELTRQRDQIERRLTKETRED